MGTFDGCEIPSEQGQLFSAFDRASKNRDSAIWNDKSGEPILIKDMETSHIMNSVNMLMRNNPLSPRMPLLMFELAMRQVQFTGTESIYKDDGD